MAFSFMRKLPSGSQLRPAAGYPLHRWWLCPGSRQSPLPSGILVGAGVAAGTAMGGTAYTRSQATLPLSPPRYQEVQAAQKALGTAVAEGSCLKLRGCWPPCSKSAQTRPCAWPHSGWHAVSSAVLGLCMGWGWGRTWQLRKPVWPGRGR